MIQEQYDFSLATLDLAERAAVVATTMAGLVPTAGTVQRQAQELVSRISQLRAQLAEWLLKDPIGPATLDAVSELRGELVSLKAETDGAKAGIATFNELIAALKADLEMVKSKVIESIQKPE